MTEPSSNHRQRNDASRERISTLVSRLDRDALGRMLPNGWSVAMTLDHIGFWDRFVLERWQAALRADRRTPESIDDTLADLVNAAISPILAELDPSAAAHRATVGATAADELLGSLGADVVAEIIKQGRPRLIDRSIHRNEHLDQIEAALTGYRPG